MTFNSTIHACGARRVPIRQVTRLHFSKRITAQKTCAVHGSQAGQSISGTETNEIIHMVSGTEGTWHSLSTCGLEALVLQKMCVTLKTANKESQTLEIVKAIPSVAAFPVLYFISPVFCPLCSLRCLKQKAFQNPSMKKMPHPRVCGKRIRTPQLVSYPSGYLCKDSLLSFIISLLEGSDFIKVHF